jgi:hypothetical protein
VTDWWRELINGENAADRMFRKMGEMSKGTGQTSIAETFIQLRKLEELRSEVFRQRAGTMPSGLLWHGLSIDLENADREGNKLIKTLEKLGFSASEVMMTTGAINRIVSELPTDVRGFAGLPDSEAVSEMFREAKISAAGLRKELADGTMNSNLYTIGMDNLRKKLEGVGATEAQIRKLGVAMKGLDVFKFAGIPSPEEFKATMADAAETMATLGRDFATGQINANQYAMAIENVTNRLKALGASDEDLNKIGLATSNVAATVGTVLDQLIAKYGSYLDILRQANEEELDRLEKYEMLTMATDLYVGAVQASAEAFVNMAAGAEGGFKKMLASVLKAIAVEAAARGAFDIIEGISRIAKSYGTDPTGPALIATGAKFLALAAAMGAAAGALSRGGGGSGGGSGGGGQAPAAPQEREPRGQTVTIQVNGSVIGSDPNEVARSFARMLETAQRDGSR